MRGGILILALTPVLGVFALFNAADLRINTSASLPVGVYIVRPNGNFVEFCPDDRGLSAQRHYRAKGVCPDGAAPLLKPVISGPVDEIVLSRVGIAVNGNLLPHTAPLERDTEGRPLVHWPPGRYAAARGTLWVASSYNARSYDSRYFGPIRESSVLARLRPLIVW
jgi:conjugative transfer signal peptidase TraF